MRAVEQAIADGVGEVGIADAGVPVFGRELAGDEGRGTLTAIFDYFDEVTALTVAKRCDEPVIDGKQVEASEAVEDARVGAITTCHGELL